MLIVNVFMVGSGMGMEGEGVGGGVVDLYSVMC